MINKTIAVLSAGHPPPRRKTITTITALGVALGTLLEPALNASAQQPFRLEGAWVITIPGTPALVTFTMSPTDSNATNAAIYGSTLIGDPTLQGTFTNAQYQTPFVGQATLTSSNTGAITFLQYGMRMGAAGPEIVYIVLNSATFTNIASGKILSAHGFSVYLPSQDSDGDGLPDPGQVPIACASFPSVGTRVALLAPCTPGPPLSINHQPDSTLALAWPASATGFTLQSVASLPGTNWVTVPGVQSNRAVIRPTDPKQFYRLEKQ